MQLIKDFPKIIFLDIDGPMIPAGMYLLDENPSYKRVMSPIAVACINHLCAKAKAKVVVNSAHNYMNTIGTDENIKLALIRNGVKEEYFHDDWRTEMHREITGSGQYNCSRQYGPILWQAKNGDANWVGFDDFQYTTSSRLVFINFDEGIHPGHINKALEIWGIDTGICNSS
jgi:hypothetical protein